MNYYLFSKNTYEKENHFQNQKILLTHFLENLEKNGLYVKKENMFQHFVNKQIFYNQTDKYLYWKTTFYKKRCIFIRNIKNLYKLNIYKNKKGYYIKIVISENKIEKFIYFSFKSEDEQYNFYESIMALLSLQYLI